MTTSVPAELERADGRSHRALSGRAEAQRRRCRCSIFGRNISASSATKASSWIAAKLGLEPINILELVTFYPMFRQAPAGRKHIRVCRTLSCAMAGAYPLMENLRQPDGNRSRSSGRRHAQSGLGQRRRRIQHRVCGMPRQLRHRAGLHGRRRSARKCRARNPRAADLCDEPLGTGHLVTLPRTRSSAASFSRTSAARTTPSTSTATCRTAATSS